jgi:hypothetical protein
VIEGLDAGPGARRREGYVIEGLDAGAGARWSEGYGAEACM